MLPLDQEETAPEGGPPTSLHMAQASPVPSQEPGAAEKGESPPHLFTQQMLGEGLPLSRWG